MRLSSGSIISGYRVIIIRIIARVGVGVGVVRAEIKIGLGVIFPQEIPGE
jgi:hypothetical protein